MRTGEHDEALRLLTEARANQPGLKQAWHLAMGLLTRLGRHPEEIELRTGFVERWPADNCTRARLCAAILRLPRAEIDTELLERMLDELEGRDFDTARLRQQLARMVGK